MRLIDSEKIPWEFSTLFVMDGSSDQYKGFIVTRKEVDKLPALEIYDGKIIEYEKIIPISFIEKEMNEIYENIKGSKNIDEKRGLSFSLFLLNALISEWRTVHNGQQ